MCLRTASALVAASGERSDSRFSDMAFMEEPSPVSGTRVRDGFFMPEETQCRGILMVMPGAGVAGTEAPKSAERIFR